MELSDQLVKFCEQVPETSGEEFAKEVRRLIREGADVWYQEEREGKSALMAAASACNYSAVEELLLYGSPWCALDRKGQCAGEYALKHNTHEGQAIVNRIVNAGVQAELLYRALEKARNVSNVTQKQTQGTTEMTSDAKDAADSSANCSVDKPKDSNAICPSSRFYLSSEVRYVGGDLFDSEDRGVMMKWEKPLMEKSAEILCGSSDVDVLNIGFGCGYVDTAIQTHGVRSHTIVEAHPRVYEKMLEDGWDQKQGVRIIFGRWQDHLDELGDYDAVYFDSFDDVADLDEFHQHLPKLVRVGGLYSYFNGVCANNIFFQGVASELILMLMRERGFEGQFLPMEVQCTNDQGWKNAQFRYFQQNNYYVPVFQRINKVEGEEA